MNMNQRLRTFPLSMVCFFLMTTSAIHAQTIDSLKVDGMTLYYHEYGPKMAEPILILTGGPGNSFVQLEEMAIVLGSRYRSILPEQRGTGKSVPEPFDSTTISIKHIADDIIRLLDSLQLEKITVLGHSWGGMLAMYMASEYPERIKKLVLVDPGPHKRAPEAFQTLNDNFMHFFKPDEVDKLSALMAASEGGTASESEAKELNKIAREAYFYTRPMPESLFEKVNTARNTKTTGLVLREVMENFDMSHRLKNFKGEVHIIAGRQDLVNFVAYEIKQDRPMAVLHWIEQCGHFPMYERPEFFYPLLEWILEKE